MRAVDLHVEAGKLANTYEHMRVWLDHEHCVPLDFDQSGDDTGATHSRLICGRRFSQRLQARVRRFGELRKCRVSGE